MKQSAQAGPYKLLQRLGEGGMGTVYMAEQSQPVRRMVALKIVRTGMDSRQVVARFEAERQALALMDHPNIARVLDAGTTASGQPFFAMELVKGIPITRFCDEHHLSPRERLELFIPVCQAVQHAHQKGIIHRDLKPSNVLVALYDDRPVPKVIDFGVAKATSQKLTDRTMFTEFGSVVGTLEYMSPEQAKLNALDVDTRSDIYALGVLLYELLTGTTPLERRRLKESALDEVLRVIREEEPPVPSTRLSQSKESLPTVAAQRQTEPERLAKMVRGELDWIVMKALEKDRSRRYETASGLARDIERYLNQQPVEACPPSLGYRLSKFFRRNRGAVLAAALLLLALVGGIAGTSLGLVAANNALNAEEQQRKIAEEERDAKERARSAAATERDQKEQARAAAEQALTVNRINLAEQYWQGNNTVQSRRILDLCPPSARGWEWHYLDRLHHADLLTLAGNGQFTTDLQFSKDGKRMAAVSPYGDAGANLESGNQSADRGHQFHDNSTPLFARRRSAPTGGRSRWGSNPALFRYGTPRRGSSSASLPSSLVRSALFPSVPTAACSPRHMLTLAMAKCSCPGSKGPGMKISWFGTLSAARRRFTPRVTEMSPNSVRTDRGCLRSRRTRRFAPSPLRRNRSALCSIRQLGPRSLRGSSGRP